MNTPKNQWRWGANLYSSKLLLYENELVYEQEIHDSAEVLYRKNWRVYEHRQSTAEFKAQGPYPLLPPGFELFVIPHDTLAQVVGWLECSEARWWRLQVEPKCTLSLHVAQRGYNLGEKIVGGLKVKGVARPLKHKGLSLRFQIPPGASGRPLGETVFLLGEGQLEPGDHSFSFSINFPPEHTRSYCLNLIACLDLIGGDDPTAIQPVFYADKPTEEELLGTEMTLRRLERPPSPPPEPKVPSAFDVLRQHAEELKKKLMARSENTELPWLTIEFEKPEPFFYTNEELRGALVINTSEAPKYKSLELSTTWKATMGNASTSTTLETLHIQSQEPNFFLSRFDFALKPFRSIHTYRGKKLKVDCSLRFRADVPWKFDPEISIPLRIEPPPLQNDNELDGALGPDFRPPPTPHWTKHIHDQEKPTLKIEPLLCRAGDQLSITLQTAFTRSTTIKVSLYCQEQIEDVSGITTEETDRVEDTVTVELGKQQTNIRLNAPHDVALTFVGPGVLVCWWVEVEIVLSLHPYRERFSVAMLPQLKVSDPYRG
jgi:hypothetical protein